MLAQGAMTRFPSSSRRVRAESPWSPADPPSGPSWFLSGSGLSLLCKDFPRFTPGAVPFSPCQRHIVPLGTIPPVQGRGKTPETVTPNGKEFLGETLLGRRTPGGREPPSGLRARGSSGNSLHVGARRAGVGTGVSGIAVAPPMTWSMRPPSRAFVAKWLTVGFAGVVTAAGFWPRPRTRPDTLRAA